MWHVDKEVWSIGSVCSEGEADGRMGVFCEL